MERRTAILISIFVIILLVVILQDLSNEEQQEQKKSNNKLYAIENSTDMPEAATCGDEAIRIINKTEFYHDEQEDEETSKIIWYKYDCEHDVWVVDLETTAILKMKYL